MSRQTLTLVGVWAALMALLAITVGATFGPFGAWKPAINLAVAFCKAGLIFWVFMHLREQRGVARVIALAFLLWLSILMGLTLADVLSR